MTLSVSLIFSYARSFFLATSRTLAVMVNALQRQRRWARSVTVRTRAPATKMGTFSDGDNARAGNEDGHVRLRRKG
eukprot:166311-Chlamydomonas_euryale.AAC.1